MQVEKQALIGKRYQYSIWRRLAIYPAVLVLLVVTVFSFDFDPTWMLLVAALLLAGLIIYAVIFSYAITLHPEKIRVENYIKGQELAWSAVGSYRSSGMGNVGYSLYDRNHSTRIVIDPEVVDFPVVNEYLRQQLPQLWNDYQDKTFSFDRLLAVAYLCVLLVLLAAGVWFVLEEPLAGVFFGVILLLISVTIFLPVLRGCRRLTITGRNLHIQPIWGEVRMVAAEEVESIHLQAEPFRFGSRRQRTEYAVWLTLKNSQKIKLAHLEQGAAVLANTLRNWWLAHGLTASRR